MHPEHLHSGIDALDQAWAGLARGAAYLLYGRARTGRDLLTLHVARTGVACDEATVLVSARSARELAEQAEPLGFDVEAACAGGALRLLRLPESLLSRPSDDAIEAALEELLGLVREGAPDRLLFEDFTPFVRFREFPRFRQAVLDFLGALAETRTVTVLGLGEPANPQSREVVAFLRGQTAGAVRLTLDPEATGPGTRRLHLLPPPGAGEPERSVVWSLARLQRSGLAAAHALFADADAAARLYAGDSAAAPEAEPAFHVLTPAASSAERGPQEPDDARPGETGGAGQPGGPGEERQHEDAGVREAPIRFFDPHDPLGPEPEVEDPFAGFFGVRDLFARAHYVEGYVPLSSEPPDPRGPGGQPPPAQDPFTHVARPVTDTPWDRHPEEPHDPFADDHPADDRPAPGRSAFASAFAAAADRALEGEPFLLLALRPEPGQAVPFKVVASGLARAAGPADALLAEPERQRLALLMPGRTPEAAQGAFRHLKTALREAGVEGALRSVSALVLPNGEPFRSAEEFFALALDGE